MSFKILARLTTDAVDAQRQAGEDWSKNPDMLALATFFDVDPKVSIDAFSFTLQASELDGAFEAGAALPLLDGAIDALVDQINGTAAILLNSYLAPARFTKQTSGPSTNSAAGSPVVFYAYAPRDLTKLAPASAAIVVAAAAADPLLALALSRLGRTEEGFTWFDLWRVWDILRKHCELIGAERHVWVGDTQRRLDFERSANDPSISGIYARHGVYSPKTDPSGQPKGNKMLPIEAAAYIHELVRKWIEEATGQTLQAEPNTP